MLTCTCWETHISAAGVVVAGMIVAVTGAAIADPIVSILIGILDPVEFLGNSERVSQYLIGRNSRRYGHGEGGADYRRVHGVLAVHDLHVWTVGSGMVCCSCHVMVNEQSVRSGENVLRAVTEELEHHFGVAHTTIQVEVEGCEPNDMYCIQRAAEGCTNLIDSMLLPYT